MSDDFYFPKGKELKPQSTTNKQGREDGELCNPGEIEWEIYRIFDGASTAYKNLIDWDLSRELARLVLPVANYTEVIWKIDLNNFFKFYHLRGDSHAQEEIQQFANAMWKLVEPKFPICCEAFIDYVVEAKTFTKAEMAIIKDNLQGSWIMSKYGLSERESKEFLEKLK
jgi:thymidylate synthase (FAD)